MPDGPKPYVIRQGDTILKLALMFDVSIEDIRDHAKNIKLREDLTSNMLPVGEIVFIPRPRPPSLNVNPQASNKFMGKVPTQSISIVFENAEGALANEAYKLYGLSEEPTEGTLDDDGKLTIECPVFVDKLRIVFEKRFVEHAIWVGHLEPVRQEAGVQARMLHLGYLPVGQRVGDPFSFADREAQAATVRVFQDAFGLSQTGFADEPTRKKLTDKHGA